MNRRVLLLAVVCFLEASTTAKCSADPLIIAGPTMGTTYRIQFEDAGQGAATALRTAIETILADVDRRLSTYRNDSEISRFNRAPAAEWFAVSPATAAVVARSLELSHQTDGALDITVGPLVCLWHFGPQSLATAQSLSDVTPPKPETIRAAQALVGFDKLEVRKDPPALRKQVAGLEIDLSAVGEGYAIDHIAHELKRRGHQNFLIELGGEIFASGRHADGRPWRVAVERPSDQPAIQAAVALESAALATSGDYRRYFEHNGRRYSHIIDPATGEPIKHNLASVTVVADDSFTADSWDTALLVLGPERGFQRAVEQNIAAQFIIRDGKSFTTRETPAWKKRFSPLAGKSP